MSVKSYPKGKKNGKKNNLADIPDKISRLLDIYTMISQGRYPSVASLAEKYKSSKRTVQRYIKIIRDIDYNVEYDRERKGYKFIGIDRLKKLSLSRDEFITLLTAAEAVSHLGGGLGNSFQKLIQRMTTLTDSSKGKSKSPVLIKMPWPVTTKKIEDHFETLSLCAIECRCVDLEYRAQKSKKVTKRTVDPYGLVFNDGVWFMVGKCHLRDEIRSFALDRIIGVAGRDHHFLRNEDFDLEKYFEKSWGIIDGEEMDVTVRFKAEVADYILRKEKWHPSEKRKILSNGDVELSFRISGFVEFKRWAYSWLPYAEFIKPGWFRKRVKEELMETAALHS